MESENSKEITEKDFSNILSNDKNEKFLSIKQTHAKNCFALAQKMVEQAIKSNPIAEGETVYAIRDIKKDGLPKKIGYYFVIVGDYLDTSYFNITFQITECDAITHWLEPIQIQKQLDTKNLLEWIEIREKDERYGKFFTDGWKKAFTAIKGKILSLLQENHD